MTAVTLAMSRPAVSSPLSHSSHGAPQKKKVSSRPAFPTSRALRPFPTTSHIFNPGQRLSPPQKSPKVIEPPKNFKASFVLDLTQAEFSRQEVY